MWGCSLLHRTIDFTHLSSSCFLTCLMKQSHAPCVEELSFAVPRAGEPWSVTAPVGEIIDGADGPWLSVLQTLWFKPAASFLSLGAMPELKGVRCKVWRQWGWAASHCSKKVLMALIVFSRDLLITLPMAQECYFSSEACVHDLKCKPKEQHDIPPN